MLALYNSKSMNTIACEDCWGNRVVAATILEVIEHRHQYQYTFWIELR